MVKRGCNSGSIHGPNMRRDQDGRTSARLAPSVISNRIRVTSSRRRLHDGRAFHERHRARGIPRQLRAPLATRQVSFDGRLLLAADVPST